MGQAEMLQELAREVRRDTLGILSASEASWCHWAPKGTSNHILWHAGHAAWLQDLMCVEPLSGASDLPAGWVASFGMNSQPDQVLNWPSPGAVQRFLEAQLQRMLELLDEVSDASLSAPPPRLSGKRSKLGWIMHGLHDEAKHCGEMYLLWKICRSASEAPS